MNFVSIGSIRTDRAVVDTTGLSDLTVDLAKGNYAPILLSEDLILIDGLRRIEAAKLLGWTEIDAIVTSDLTEILDYLREAHKDGMPSPRRVYEGRQVIQALITAYHSELKRRHQWRRDSRPSDFTTTRSRDYYKEAFNLPYGSLISRITRAFRLAEAGNKQAIEMVQRMDAGEMTGSTAYDQLTKRYGAAPPNLGRAEQRVVLEESIRSLSMVTKTLRTLGGKIRLPQEELLPLITQLKAQRSEMYTTIGRLAKEAKDKDE